MKAIAKVTAPNPQGKAQLPVLDLLQKTGRHPRPLKLSEQQSAEAYLCGALVLSAKFNFEPRPGKTYYLYWQAPNWKLSMIEPEADQNGRLGEFYASCKLDKDWLWQVQPRASTDLGQELVAALVDFYEQTQRFIAKHTNIDEQLPWYVAELPFYHRVAARAMALRLRPCVARRGIHLEDQTHIRAIGSMAGS